MSFIAYYILMCLLGVVVVTATIMRNKASTQRRCILWNRAALVTWHLGAILFIAYLTDPLIIT